MKGFITSFSDYLSMNNKLFTSSFTIKKTESWTWFRSSIAGVAQSICICILYDTYELNDYKTDTKM